MTMLLISQCLLGYRCRYDSSASSDMRERLSRLGYSEQDLLAVCPETLGGLPTPRFPAEVITIQGKRVVINKAGQDVTQAFRDGANQTLQLAQKYQVRKALLKSKSPSCGVHAIYDGHFHGVLKSEPGLTAEKLVAAGIHVLDETEIDQLPPNKECSTSSTEKR